MPAVQYPFIDIAVHPRVKARFVRGEAIALFSPDMERMLWANGAGARLFGNPIIYDLVDGGLNRQDITFRQLEATARQLRTVGETRTLLVRIGEGFRRLAVQASVELVRTQAGEDAVLFAVPNSGRSLDPSECARQMLSGFDDPDTHMAILDDRGSVIAASDGFARLGITAETTQLLVTMVGSNPDHLMKRPIPSARGYLPAAIGKLSENPGLHLLFAIETVLGNLDPTTDFAPEQAHAQSVAAQETAEDMTDAPQAEESPVAHVSTIPFDEALDAVSDIEDLDDGPEVDETSGDEIAADEPPRDDEIIEEEAVEQADTPADPSTPDDDMLPAPDADIERLDTAGSAPAMPSDERTGPEASADAAAGEALPTAEDQTDIAATETDGESTTPVTLPKTPSQFIFNPQVRATRFVWKIDAEGRFREVSGEFAHAVGPHAASINGVAFVDLAHLFNLDPEGKIVELLSRRDTWSGKTIYWPVEGTSLSVPVDLAALPTYTRGREFDGFRGFGIVRPADAIADPLELGLTLTPTIETAAVETKTAIVEESAAAPAAADPVDTQHDVDASIDEHIDVLPDPSTGEEVAAQTSESQPLPDREPPVLQIVSPTERIYSDKVVQLETHRARSRDGLSAGEQAAFLEIARQLEPMIERPSADEAEQTMREATETSQTADTTHHSEPALDSENVAASTPPHDDADHATEASSDSSSTGETLAEGTVDSAHNAEIAEANEDDDAHLNDVLTTLIQPRARMIDGLSPDTLDQMPVALLIHAGDSLFHANPEFLRLTGYQTLKDLIDVGGLDALLQRDELHENTETGGSGLMLVRADDELVSVTARLQSVRWEQTNALMLALMPAGSAQAARIEPVEVHESQTDDSIHQEMTEKLARQQDELEELRSILETATDGVVIIGESGDIRSMNRSASALFNYDNQETHGKPFVMLFAHESQKAVLDYLSGLSGHGVASVLNDGREVIGREASGGFIPLFMTIGQLTASNGYCAVIRDVTQWKRTEDELRNAKRAAETANAHKSDFLARVSHEIRTPLNAIIGFSDMMATERFGPIGHPRYIEYANDIGRSGRHVLDIVNDLLDISKIEAGEMDLEFTSVGLNESVAEAVALVQPQANGQRVIIRTSLSQSVPHVVADQRSIKQIALNILSNAIRFTPSGGQIVVSTSYEVNGSVVLRIRDTGVGMTRSELEQAMKPFRQVTTNARGRGDGTGLGLPLTKAMVDANRASFSINSVPNEGTLVEVTFPSQRVLAN